MESADSRPTACSGASSSGPSIVACIERLHYAAAIRSAWYLMLVLAVCAGLTVRAAMAGEAASPVRLIDASPAAEAAVFAVKDELLLVRKGDPVAESGFSLYRVVRGGVLLSVGTGTDKFDASQPLREGNRLLSLKLGDTLDKRAGALLAAGTEEAPVQIEVSEFGDASGGDDE